MAEKKLRVRFGLKLTWPITNAATFVFYTTTATFAQMRDAINTVKSLLVLSGREDIADRLICEVS